MKQEISNLGLVQAGQPDYSSVVTLVTANCPELAEFFQAWVTNVTASAFLSGGRS